MEKREYKWKDSLSLVGYKECMFGKGSETRRDCYCVDSDALCAYVQWKLHLSKPLKDDDNRDKIIAQMRKIIQKTLYNALGHTKSITYIDIYYKTLMLRFHFSTSYLLPQPETIVEIIDKVQQVLTENGF
mgnify:CR=1 FL=1